MRSLLVVSLLVAATAAPNYKKTRTSVCYDELGCFNQGYPFQDFPLPWSPDRIEVTLMAYSRNNPTSAELITRNTVGPNFRTNRETKLIIHGFNSGSDADWFPRMTDEFLRQGDYNVIWVDWSGGSKVWLWEYDQAASNTRVVGAELALTLNNLVQMYGLRLRDVHCIGHSLGSHICGFAGQKTNSMLGRITGLDPAGPLFFDQPVNGRLDRTDADFVDIIHTHGHDGLLMNFGIGQQIGDVDFVPNGGGVQPGCFNRGSVADDKDKYGDLLSCSHSRAVEYFVESINSACGFTAALCPNREALDSVRIHSMANEIDYDHQECKYKIVILAFRFMGPYHLLPPEELKECPDHARDRHNSSSDISLSVSGQLVNQSANKTPDVLFCALVRAIYYPKQNGSCSDCNGNCQQMGMGSLRYPGRGIFYLETNSASPFCRN